MNNMVDVDVDYHLNIKLADISAKKNEVEEENQTNTNYNLGKINFSEFDRQLGTDIEGNIVHLHFFFRFFIFHNLISRFSLSKSNF